MRDRGHRTRGVAQQAEEAAFLRKWGTEFVVVERRESLPGNQPPQLLLVLSSSTPRSHRLGPVILDHVGDEDSPRCHAPSVLPRR